MFIFRVTGTSKGRRRAPMIVCFRCAKPITGVVVHHVPPRLIEELGVDFRRAYHPKCHEEDEKDAERELRGNEVQ